MNEYLIEGLGIVAGGLSAISFIPQIVKIVRTRDTSSISLRMFVITVTGFALWAAYGILTGRPAVIAANIVSFCLSGAILLAKFRFG